MKKLPRPLKRLQLSDDMKRRALTIARAALFLLGLSILVLAIGMTMRWLFQAIAPTDASGRNEFARTAIQALVGLGQLLGATVLGFGLYFTWKTLEVNRQSLVESQKANRERERISQEGNITDRYTRAIEQLGATDGEGQPRLELRLGAIYALQRIARDSERDHWPIMQILAAYIRMNAPAKPTDYRQMVLFLADGKGVEWLRQTAPRADIDAVIEVLRNRGRFIGEGEDLSFELTHCDLQGVRFFDVKESHFEWSNFAWSNLGLANLSLVKLTHANFAGANLTGAQLNGAELQEASFIGASLVLAQLELANLTGADFQGANLRGANLSMAHLQGSNLEAADSLEGTILYLANGLSDEQRRICAAKGALIEASAG